MKVVRCEEEKMSYQKDKLISLLTKQILQKFDGFCPSCGVRLFPIKGKRRCPCCDLNEEEQKVEREK